MPSFSYKDHVKVVEDFHLDLYKMKLNFLFKKQKPAFYVLQGFLVSYNHFYLYLKILSNCLKF